ncbi:DALR anticodon-binding domain-containing protein [Leptolyngbya sp. FACHB-17]|uniref:DALR anticodon-binding domain-containing protein n=1 Tax=unclassified Leptolyngbya TaxID=2650499 RepID=UPI0016810F55|nr:DALR anticodon-binding domain-containing protein [Leptolyngbya sp. FACHB-17]MBD2079632.1 hypothetical protein [Leptolyngbya sp. FACHB-17]
MHSKFEIELSNFKHFQQLSVPKQVRNQTAIALYRSSIALQFGAGSIQTTQQVAGQIIDFFLSSPFDSAKTEIEKKLLRDLTVRATEAGQLEFEFGAIAISAWLQVVLRHCSSQGLEWQSNAVPDQTLSKNPEVFFCQYSYARCAALLRLVDSQVLISQEAIWLRDGKLLLQQERSLTAQIVTTLDTWEEATVLKSAIALSQAFQAFYPHCQIVKYDTVDCEIAQCRLALVMITHWLLKQLLEQGLGVLAPETL